MQFHPEKSGLEGLKIYRNWAYKVNEYEELKKK
jgi:imidazoleglycerol phosphate synthase glutamine amidotransferase subunit HisH